MSLDTDGYIDGFDVILDQKKVKLPEKVELSICKGDDYGVYLGSNCIFTSKDEEIAREYYEVLRFEIKRGNYQLIFNSSLHPRIESG